MGNNFRQTRTITQTQKGGTVHVHEREIHEVQVDPVQGTEVGYNSSRTWHCTVKKRGYNLGWTRAIDKKQEYKSSWICARKEGRIQVKHAQGTKVDFKLNMRIEFKVEFRLNTCKRWKVEFKLNVRKWWRLKFMQVGHLQEMKVEFRLNTRKKWR